MYNMNVDGNDSRLRISKFKLLTPEERRSVQSISADCFSESGSDPEKIESRKVSARGNLPAGCTAEQIFLFLQRVRQEAGIVLSLKS